MSLAHFWLTSSEISVSDAAHLAVGLYPEGFCINETNYTFGERKQFVAPMIRAITSRILSNDLKATVKLPEVNEKNEIVINSSSDGTKISDYLNNRPEFVYISPYEFKNLIEEIRFDEDFFMKNADVINHNYFRNMKQKLHSEKVQLSKTMEAALDALEYLKCNPNSLKNKSPKQAVEKWLTENHKKYELTNNSGEPSNKAINAIAAVVNWNKTGGTPSIG